MWFLERQRAGIVKVSGVTEAVVHVGKRLPRGTIAGMGCKIIGEQNKFVRREFLFVVDAPPGAAARTPCRPSSTACRAELRGVVELEQL
jgi:hypothetical protein